MVTANQILDLFIYLPPIVLAVTLHEVAHGWVAREHGDATAAEQGRLSLNPLRHVDLVGTILLPLVLLKLTGVAFGWAKPVPVNWLNLRNPQRDMALVAIAGPTANLAMLLGWTLILRLAVLLVPVNFAFASSLLEMGKVGIISNAILMMINLLPIPPLDGSRVLAAAMPRRLAFEFQRLEPYGLIVVMALLLSSTLGRLLDPILTAIERFALRLAGL